MPATQISDIQARWIVVGLTLVGFLTCLSPFHSYNAFPGTWSLGALVLLMLHGEPPNASIRLVLSFVFGVLCFEVLPFFQDQQRFWILIFPIAIIVLCLGARRLAAITRISKALLLLASVIAAGFLITASSPDYGANPMLNWFSQFGWSPEFAEVCTIVVRKAVHLSFYGLIAGTAFLSFEPASLNWNRITWPLAWTLLHASFDEYRQSLTPNRTGTIADVAIDLVGAGAAVWLLHRYANRNQTAYESSQAPLA